MLGGIKNLFELGKDKALKRFRLEKKKDKAIKIEVFEEEEENYYQPIAIGDAFSSNYIKYKSNGEKENFLKINLNGLIDYFNTQGEWKIQLTMAIHFFLLDVLTKLALCIKKVIT